MRMGSEGLFYYIMWKAGRVYVAYLGKTWHQQDALWEEGMLAEAV